MAKSNLNYPRKAKFTIADCIALNDSLNAQTVRTLVRDAIDSVEAELEALIRSLAQGYESETVLPDGDADYFINGKAGSRVTEKLNLAAMKIIGSKVRRHPSLGVTLK